MDFVEIFNIILDLSITCFSRFSGCWASFMFIVITLSWNAITCFLESSWVWDRFLLFRKENTSYAFLDSSVRLDSMPNKTEHLDWKLFGLSLAKKHFNPIAYGILRLSQLRGGGGGGGGFLSYTPENSVKIIWLVWNLVLIINGIRLLRKRNFRKFAVLFLEIRRHKIRLFTRKQFIAFLCLPPEFLFNDAKTTFLLS